MGKLVSKCCSADAQARKASSIQISASEAPNVQPAVNYTDAEPMICAPSRLHQQVALHLQGVHKCCTGCRLRSCTSDRCKGCRRLLPESRRTSQNCRPMPRIHRRVCKGCAGRPFQGWTRRGGYRCPVRAGASRRVCTAMRTQGSAWRSRRSFSSSSGSLLSASGRSAPDLQNRSGCRPTCSRKGARSVHSVDSVKHVCNTRKRLYAIHALQLAASPKASFVWQRSDRCVHPAGVCSCGG